MKQTLSTMVFQIFSRQCNGMVVILFWGTIVDFNGFTATALYCSDDGMVTFPAYLVFVFVFVIALVRSCILITGGEYPPLGWVPFPLMVQPLNNRYHPPPGPPLHTQSCNSITNHMRRTQNIRKVSQKYK